jgi:hypothetical protein
MANVLVTQGTQTAIATDTIGTVDYQIVEVHPKSGVSVATYGTVGTAGAAAYGTLVAAPGVGTALHINDLSMSVTSGTVDCMIAFGTLTTGAGVLARGQYTPGGGIQKSFPRSVNGNTTNAPLVYWLGGAGTVSFNVTYITL